jgi:hypothetical protein
MGPAFLCVLCSKTVTSVAHALHHNRQRPHQGRLRARGLPAEHEADAYLSSNVERLSPPPPDPGGGPAAGVGYAPRLQILRGVEAAAVIGEVRCDGVSVPLDVAAVVLMAKVFDMRARKADFDKDSLIAWGFEITGSVLLMDSDTRAVLGMVCHAAVERTAADALCGDGLTLARSGGYVERSADKEATAMAMFGFRFAGKEFGR